MRTIFRHRGQQKNLTSLMRQREERLSQHMGQPCDHQTIQTGGMWENMLHFLFGFGNLPAGLFSCCFCASLLSVVRRQTNFKLPASCFDWFWFLFFQALEVLDESRWPKGKTSDGLACCLPSKQPKNCLVQS